LKPNLEDVLFFHTVCIELYGGAGGVRDEGSLEAAIARPWLIVNGEEAFPTPYTDFPHPPATKQIINASERKPAFLRALRASNVRWDSRFELPIDS
jgi:hypothetical protein